MASIVVTGGGMAGLISAMLLADDGHQVVVLERDAAPPPDPVEAWDGWNRRGVNQFHMVHYLLARFLTEAERSLPRVVAALEQAGALRINLLEGIPDQLTGGPRPGDEDFASVTARRPVIESVVAACAADTGGVSIRRGVAVSGLTTGTAALAGVPHVTGVTTEDGEVISADLVVDATGRRSPLPGWIEAAGGRRPAEELEDSGFVYYGRHFRSADGSLPPIIGPLLQNYGSVSLLSLPADNGTWGLAIIASAADAAMRGARDVEAWTAAVGAMPLAAHWLDGEPLEDRVQVMAKIEDRHRRFVIGGEPVATGVLAVADSWACTNPSLGRGISMALVHAVALRQLLQESSLDEPARLARAWDEATSATVEPWYRSTVAFDRHRLAQIDAEVAGESYRPEDPGWEMSQGLGFAAGQDPDCLRAFIRVAAMQQTPQEAMAEAGLFEKVIALGAGWRDGPVLGPSRDELMAIVSR